MICPMEYTIPLDISVEVADRQAVIDAAKAEMRLRHGIDDEYWETAVLPAIAQHGLNQALSILLLSDEITGFLRHTLERVVPGLRVAAISVVDADGQRTL
jgi:hypothetical protein